MTTNDQNIIRETRILQDYTQVILDEVNVLRLNCNLAKTAMHVSEAKKFLAHAIASLEAARETQTAHIIHCAERGIKRINELP